MLSGRDIRKISSATSYSGDPHSSIASMRTKLRMALRDESRVTISLSSAQLHDLCVFAGKPTATTDVLNGIEATRSKQAT